MAGEYNLYELNKAFKDIYKEIDKLKCCCESLTGKNLGSGAPIFYKKSNNNLQFRSLVEGTNISITSTNDTITINSTGGGSSFSCSDLLACSTDSLPEGLSNLYYTPTRFDTAFATKTTSDLTEGSNLYYTDAKVLSYITGKNISIFTNDSGYITSSALTPYLTIATASSTYYPIPVGTTLQYLRGDGSLATFPTIPTVTPSALTKTDDTNITLTVGGTPTTALLQPVSLTLGWTGILDYTRGGTGLGSLGTSLQLVRVNAGGTGLEYFTPSYISTAITSLNGLTGTTQTFSNDTNIVIVSSGVNHGLTWAGTLADARITSSTIWNNKVTSLSAGTGISIGGSITIPIITNTLPDQIVTLTQGGTTTITGTYPNFTISSADSTVGTVISVATGTGLTGGTITTSGTLALNSKLSPLDTLTSNSLKLLRVNLGETAVEYFTPTYGTGSVTSVAMTVPTGLNVIGSPVTTSGTLAVSISPGYFIPLITDKTNWDTAYTNRIVSASIPLSITSNIISIPLGTSIVDGYLSALDRINFQTAYTNRITSLTTLGTSGASTLIFNTLNIPQYQAAGTYVISVTGTANRITSTGGITPVIDIGTDVVTLTGAQALSNKTGNISQWTNNSGYLTTISGITAGGELSGTYVNPTLLNSAVIGKVLTGYISGAGTIAATDNILQAIQKLNGNIGSLTTGVSSVNALTGAVALTGTTNRLTISVANVFDISATFENLLGKVASPLSQFASTTSAQLRSVLSDELGTGAALFDGATPTSFILTNATGLPDAGLITSYLKADGTRPLTANWTTGEFNLVFGTTTGTKFGTATTQKIGFYNSTPVVQQTGSVITGLNTLGLFTGVTIQESELTITNITTNNTTISAHGFFPKLTSNSIYYVNNAGALTALTVGATGTVLTGNGVTSAPTFTTPSSAGITWTEITGTSQTAVINTGYILNNAGLVTLTLPSTSAVGSVVYVAGKGAGLWKVAQNASGQIHFGNQDTTVGTGGSVAATLRYDCIQLVCTVANNEWVVLNCQGNITIV